MGAGCRTASGRAGRPSWPALTVCLTVLCLSAQPAAAQPTPQTPAQPPAAGLPIAPILACLEGHFDPDRYRAALVQAGWQIAPSEMRSDIALRLADAFEPLAGAQAEGTAPADSTSRQANRAEWLRLTQDRTLMIRPGAVLFVTGLTASDGQRAMECWVSLAEGDLVDDLFETALADQPEAMPQGDAVLSFGPFALPDDGAFTMLATRRRANSADAAASSDRLNARHGLMTRSLFPPSE